MKNTLIAAAVIILLGAGYFAWKTFAPQLQQEPVPVQEQITTSTYATTTFSIRYPSSFTADDSYAYDQFKGKPIAGVKFMVPATLTNGTNLSSDSGVSVESLPRAKNCTGDIYLPASVKAFSLTVGSTTYSVATSTGAAAGNIYEEQIFAIKGSSPCTAVRYFIHSGNIGNYPQQGEGSVHAFDRGALIRTFDEIRGSLVFQ